MQIIFQTVTDRSSLHHHCIHITNMVMSGFSISINLLVLSAVVFLYCIFVSFLNCPPFKWIYTGNKRE